MQEPAVALVRVPRTTAFSAAAGFETHAATLSVLLCQFTSCTSGNEVNASQTRQEQRGMNEDLYCGLHDAAGGDE